MAMRSSASMTITSTAALMPKKTASTTGTFPKAAYTIDSASTTTAPGSTNSRPAARAPFSPCNRQPTYVASCIASGPGNNMQKLSALRKCGSSSHFFSSTMVRCVQGNLRGRSAET